MYFGTFARFRVKGKQLAVEEVRLADDYRTRSYHFCNSDISYRNILDRMLDRYDPFRRQVPESLADTARKLRAMREKLEFARSHGWEILTPV